MFAPPPPKTHINNRGGGPLAKMLACPSSLREGGWVNTATGHGPPLSNKNAYPRGGPLENFQQGPGDAYLPGDNPPLIFFCSPFP